MPPQAIGDTPREVRFWALPARGNFGRLLKIGYQSVVIGGI
ncbi:hypothetical protein [Microcoleus sp. herbarium14]